MLSGIVNGAGARCTVQGAVLCMVQVQSVGGPHAQHLHSTARCTLNGAPCTNVRAGTVQGALLCMVQVRPLAGSTLSTWTAPHGAL